MGGVFTLWNVAGHWEWEGTDSPLHGTRYRAAVRPSAATLKQAHGRVEEVRRAGDAGCVAWVVPANGCVTGWKLIQPCLELGCIPDVCEVAMNIFFRITAHRGVLLATLRMHSASPWKTLTPFSELTREVL